MIVCVHDVQMKVEGLPCKFMLWDNRIEEDGLMNLGLALEHNRSLQFLHLGLNCFGTGPGPEKVRDPEDSEEDIDFKSGQYQFDYTTTMLISQIKGSINHSN